MQPALPEEPFGESAEPSPGLSADHAEVGEFRPGSPLSRWALARYLVGRAIGESVSRTLLLVAGVLLAIAAGFQWGLHVTVLAVLVALVALFVLFLRWVLRALLRRLTAAEIYEPVADRLRALVADTSGDVLRELRRLGLPSHLLTLPLLAVRLVGKRRAETFERLRAFDVDRVVPKARLDELHLLLRNAGTAHR